MSFSQGAMTDAAVSLQALTRRFGELVAVDALTFDVAQGELFGIVGPDGAGKTTLLRMLAGVLPPSGGTAVVLGHDVARDPERVKHDIAYMAQRFGLYEDLTVRENVMFYADLYRVPKAERSKRLERLYAFSRLGEFEHRLAGKLSGGMKQKLSLCCALIHKPRVLLLDEPTFGVDPISRRDLWLILHEMVAEGVTIVVTTSYLDEAERCDRVAMLHEGQLLALDTPAKLQDSLDGVMYAMESHAARTMRDSIRSAAGVKAATLFGERLHVLTDRSTSADALRSSLQERGVMIENIDQIEPSLEDVFIRLVGAHDRAS
jgi:ABC-2 type transport system ATP-binding protein